MTTVSFRSVRLPASIAGQLHLHSMPGRYEPLDAVLREIAARGVSCVAYLAPIDEIDRKSPDYARALRDGSAPCIIKIDPIPDYAAPDDEAAFWKFAQELADGLKAGKAILIHCGAGVGRTGTMAAAVLMMLGSSGEAALKTVKAAGSGPETARSAPCSLRHMAVDANSVIVVMRSQP